MIRISFAARRIWDISRCRIFSFRVPDLVLLSLLLFRGVFSIIDNKHIILTISLACFFLDGASSISAQLPSFPEAEGFGAISVGERGGEFIQSPDFTDPSLDNWAMLAFHYTDGDGQRQSGDPLPSSWRRYSRINQSPYPITLQSAQDSFDSIIGSLSDYGDVGDNARIDKNGHWVERIDSVDVNLLADVINNSGPNTDEENDHVSDYGGYPVNDAGTPYIDSDHDGMADEWERIRFGDLITAQYDADNKTDYDLDGYHDLEEFLNGSNPKKSPIFYWPMFLPAITGKSTP